MNFSASEKNEFLDTTIARVDDEIRALLAKKALLRRRANALRERTCILPPETLTAIFEHAIHENNHSVLGISAVCYRWRQIVWTSPTLWTSILLGTSQSGARNLFDLHRQNAKDASLSIRLFTQHGFKAPLHMLLELLRVALTECTGKIQSLNLGPLDKTVWQFITPYSMYADFPRLHSLKLDFKHNFHASFEGTLFSRSPRLRTVELREPFLGIELQLPFHNLATLVLNKPNPAHAFYLLSHCPNLVEFRSEGDSYSSPESPSFGLSEPVTLENLESITWASGQLPSSATFISDIHLPSVRQLSWLSNLDSTTSCIWKPLFSSMSRVKALDCKYSAGLLELLDSLPSLERLHIKFDSFFDHLWDITNFLSQLVWREGAGRLPNLMEFSIILEDNNKVVSKERLPFHDVMIQGLESRRLERDWRSCARLEKFTLKIAVLGVWGTWQRCLANELKQLGQQGLDVTVVQ